MRLTEEVVGVKWKRTWGFWLAGLLCLGPCAVRRAQSKIHNQACHIQAYTFRKRCQDIDAGKEEDKPADKEEETENPEV